jgi:hypothetical protein
VNREGWRFPIGEVGQEWQIDARYLRPVDDGS